MANELTEADLEQGRAVTATTIRFWSGKAAEVLARHSVVLNRRLTDTEVELLAISLGVHIGRTMLEDCVGSA